MKSRHDEIRKKYGKSVDMVTLCIHMKFQLIVLQYMTIYYRQQELPYYLLLWLHSPEVEGCFRFAKITIKKSHFIVLSIELNR